MSNELKQIKLATLKTFRALTLRQSNSLNVVSITNLFLFGYFLFPLFHFYMTTLLQLGVCQITRGPIFTVKIPKLGKTQRFRAGQDPLHLSYCRFCSPNKVVLETVKMSTKTSGMKFLQHPIFAKFTVSINLRK